jgi:thermolysin
MPVQFESLARLAEDDPSLRFRTDDDLGVVAHLRGRLAKSRDGSSERDLERAGIEFMREHPDLFGDVTADELVVLDAGPDPAGGANVVLEQRFAGHRVIGGSVRFHADKSGVLDTISNRTFPDLSDIPSTPRFDAGEAVRQVREATRSRAEPKQDPELVVVRHERRPHLAWEVRLDTDTDQVGDWGEPTQWVSYVDAETGDVLLTYNNIQTAGPVTAAGTGFYSGTGQLNAWFDDTTYQLRDTTRTAGGGPEVVTNDEDGASPSEDADGNWNTLTTSPRDGNQGAEVDAHRYSGAVVDYFNNVHGRRSFDNAGGTHTILVHLSTNYSNGYWDGTQVNLGDGTGVAPGDDYECSDDWLAHEWTHAYTERTCGLVYNAESGALNEAFSDIFAAFITGDWLVFEDTWLNAAPAWRNMIDPTNGGQWNVNDPINSVVSGHQPSHYSVRYTGAWDNGGVHVNSGIINNLFYLLTVGGTHTVSNIAVAGIGQPAAERMLWRCMTINLVGQPNATFLQFREAMLDACLDLFPTDLFKLTQVKAAFNAVGIGPDMYLRDNLGDTGAEPNPTGILSMSPDIINRTAVVANPTVTLGDLTNGSLGQNIEFGQDNYVYVRLHNRGPQSGDTTTRVYFSPATGFAVPSSWTLIGTLTTTGVAPGATVVAGPVTFSSALVPAPGHYCLIAVASSTLDPAPDTSLISSVSMYVDYVRDTNNIAWKNLDVVDDVQPGTAGLFEVMVQAIGDDIDDYLLVIDVARYFPDARVRIHGPAKLLDFAKPFGLRRVDEGGDDAVFEVVRTKRPGRVGFGGVVVPEHFALRVEFEVPRGVQARGAGRLDARVPGRLVVNQYRRGELLGGAGVVVEVPRDARRLNPA